MLRRIVCLFLLGGFVCLLYVYFSGDPAADDDSEFVSKREWSVLQGLEFEYRETESFGKIRIISHAAGSEYSVLGIPIHGQKLGYVWVLANPSSEPKVKVLPNGILFDLTMPVLVRVRGEIYLDPAVSDFLDRSANEK